MIVIQYNPNKVSVTEISEVFDRMREINKDEHIISVPDGFAISELMNSEGKARLRELRDAIDLYLSKSEE